MTVPIVNEMDRLRRLVDEAEAKAYQWKKEVEQRKRDLAHFQVKNRKPDDNAA